MFNLEEQIQSWRASIAAQLGNQPMVLEELESHLRDHLKQLMDGGKSQEDSFLIATQRLGKPNDMAREFGKIRPRRWIPAQVGATALCLILVIIFSLQVSRLYVTPLLMFHVVCLTAGYVTLLTIGFLAAWAAIMRGIVGSSEHQTEGLRRVGKLLALFGVVTTVVGIILGVVWSHAFHSYRWDWRIAKEIGAVCVLLWSIILLLSYRTADVGARSLMIIAIIGNIVVCLSWLGPILLMNDLPRNISSVFGWSMGLFLLIHFLAIYLSTLQAGSLRIGRFIAGQH